MKRIALVRQAMFAAVAVAATLAIAAPANARTPVLGADTFASGDPAEAILENGSGSRDGFGSDWRGLLGTWSANPSTDETWTGGNTTFQLTGSPTLTYTPTNTEAGYAEFGSEETVSPYTSFVDPAQDPTADAQSPPVLDGFTSTDDDPTNIEFAFNATGGATEDVVPIAQAPVVVMFSLPSGVTIGAGGHLALINQSPGDLFSTLQAIYDDNVGATGGYPANTWGALLIRAGFSAVASGNPTATQFLDSGTASTHTGGYQPVEIEVRNGDAATTNVLQGFLCLSGDNRYCGFGEAERNWPSDANDGHRSNGYPAGPYGANTEAATLVKNTLATPGSIGYALLSDAVYSVLNTPFTGVVETSTFGRTPAHQFLFASLQSDEGTTTSRHYALPGAVTTNSHGSVEAIPNLYSGSTISRDCLYARTQTTGVGVWCQEDGYEHVLASDPATYLHSGTDDADRVNAYPIVELNYDVFWQSYTADDLTQPGFYNSVANATNVGNTTFSYLAWAVKPTGGQAALTSAKIGWQILPGPIQQSAQFVGDLEPH